MRLALFKKVVRAHHVSHAEAACLGKWKEGTELPTRKPQPANKLAKRHKGGFRTIYSICCRAGEVGRIPLFVISWWILDHKVRAELLWRDALKGTEGTGDVLARGEG